MTLYHGGTVIVDSPRIIQSDIGRDFGCGFYTTDIRIQAEKWARRTARIRKTDSAVLNIYEYDEAAQKVLRIKSYDSYSMEWLDTVIECRQHPSYVHGYDIMSGKIANDNVGETVQAVIDGFTPKEYALTKLAFMTANNQICFCTEQSLRYLRFVSSERLVLK